ncbi:MAG: response regulator transcription factor [Bacteroidaceae bacterium]|nr:response regulator transcription factor [Bacteroidaceae bacterium]
MTDMRYIIIEDERLAYEDVRRMMERLRPDYQLVGWAQGVEQGALMLHETECDLLISDIRLEDGLSFDLFDQSGTVLPIIFTTAYDEYALRAFKVNGVDYLLKPISDAELETALRKFEHNAGLTADSERFDQLRRSYMEKRWKKRFLLHAGKKYKYVIDKGVAAIYADNKTTDLITIKGATYTINYTIEELEHMLDPAIFFRVSRGVILNINNIKETSNQKDRLEAVLKVPLNRAIKGGTSNGEQVPVARERRKAYLEWLDM